MVVGQYVGAALMSLTTIVDRVTLIAVNDRNSYNTLLNLFIDIENDSSTSQACAR